MNAKGLLTSYSQYRHGQLRLLENLVVFGVLGESCELSKTGAHSAGLGVGRCKEVSGGFIRLAAVAREVIPDTVEIDALAASDKPLCVGAVKMEMPDAGIEQDFIPRLNSGDRSVHYDEAFDFIGIKGSVGVTHHVSNVVSNDGGAVIAQCGDDCAHVLGLSFLVIAAFRLRGVADAAEVGYNHCVVLH